MVLRYNYNFKSFFFLPGLRFSPDTEYLSHISYNSCRHIYHLSVADESMYSKNTYASLFSFLVIIGLNLSLILGVLLVNVLIFIKNKN